MGMRDHPSIPRPDLAVNYQQHHLPYMSRILVFSSTVLSVFPSLEIFPSRRIRPFPRGSMPFLGMILLAQDKTAAIIPAFEVFLELLTSRPGEQEPGSQA